MAGARGDENRTNDLAGRSEIGKVPTRQHAGRGGLGPGFEEGLLAVNGGQRGIGSLVSLKPVLDGKTITAPTVPGIGGSGLPVAGRSVVMVTAHHSPPRTAAPTVLIFVITPTPTGTCRHNENATHCQKKPLKLTCLKDVSVLC